MVVAKKIRLQSAKATLLGFIETGLIDDTGDFIPSSKWWLLHLLRKP